MPSVLRLCCCYSPHPYAVGAAGISNFDLLKVMSVSDFHAAGLDKLSDAQLKTLGDRLTQYAEQHPSGCGQATKPNSAVSVVPAIAAPASAARSAKSASDHETIVSHLIVPLRVGPAAQCICNQTAIKASSSCHSVPLISLAPRTEGHDKCVRFIGQDYC